ncbi:MAG: DNA polymerase III subunit gamma/tau [Bacteroidales bacterium]|nr:DNA polymerase III subunit gamma/tau [Bacteroidales bacterium]
MEDNERYIVSARKYRPSTFGSVVGQEALTHTLKNAVASGRLAQAYLFCGPRGVGKTSCARIFAKRINCLSPTEDGEACGKCESCKAIEQGASFNIVELDAASNNSVDDIRALTEQVSMPPQTGRYRVFIIDEVHMLSSSAFNAFLKTLEEPPSYVIFILATTEKHKVIPTILSRCQIYDFKRITIDDMASHLSYVAAQEGIEAEPAALAVIAQKADGAMRDALSIFDQVAASSAGHVTYDKTIASLNVLDYGYYFRLTRAFHDGNVAQALLIYKEIRDAGFDSLFFINGLASHVRDLMVASDPSTAPLLEVGEEIGKQYTALAQSLPLQWYYGAMRILNDADLNYRTSGNKQLLVELALIRLCGQGSQPLRSAAPSPSAATSNAPAANSPAPSASSAQRQAPSPTALHSSPASTPRAPHAPSGASVRPAAPGARHTPPPAAGVHRMPHSSPAAKSQPASPAESEPAPDSSQPPAGLSRPYSPEDFTAAWHEFANSHHELPLLTTAMLAAHPHHLGEHRYAIGVVGQAQASTFDNDLPTLTEFLRKRLSNENIVVGVVQVEPKARPKKLTPAEKLRKIIEDNPKLGELLDEMDAELV